MIVHFELHGLDDELVEGKLDTEDLPVPQIGWLMDFDVVGQVRVFDIHGYYVALGRHQVTLQLVRETYPGVINTAAEVVEFFRINSDLTAFSEVRVGGGMCTCPRC